MKTQTLELTGGRTEFLKALDKAQRTFSYLTYEHGRGWSAQTKKIDINTPEDFQVLGGEVKEKDYSQIESSIITELEAYYAWESEEEAKLDAELAEYAGVES